MDSDALLKRLNESTTSIHTVEIESTCKLHQVLIRYSLPSCLRVLRIKDNSLNFEDICDLVSSLSRVNSLHELDLCRTKFEECSFNSFLCVLRYLRGLSLADNGLTDQEITNLITALKLMRSLKRLNLSKSKITETQANVLLQELEQANQIASLDLSHNALQGNEIIIGICQLQSLQEVDLSHNFIRFSPFEGNHDSLSINTKNISLSSNHMMPNDISQFCSLIGSDLLKLSLDFNHVGNSIWSLCSIHPRIKHLKVLSLENIYISYARAVHGLATLLSSVRALEELNLSSNNLVLADFQELQSPLSNLSQLKRLNLSNNPDGISILLEKILPSLKNLEELRLSNTHLNCDDLNAICTCNSLAFLNSLKYLELSMNSIGSEGIRELANTLKEFPLLERLDLSRSCLQGDDINVLCQGLVSLKKLKYLDLSGNIIDGQILDDTWVLPPTLDELTFSDVIHGEKLFAKIKTLQNLKKLHLTNLKLRACDVEILATTLSSFPKMEELSLGDIVIACSCEYSCKCYEQLFTALGNLIYLKELELSEMHISETTGAEALTCVLPSLTLLEKLVLGYILVDDEHNKQLFSALGNLTCLKELYLRGVHMSKTGVQTLARVLPLLTLLEKLVLGYMFAFDDECNELLFAALGNLKYLKELELNEMHISETTGAEALTRVLPSLTLLEKLALRYIRSGDVCERQLLPALGNFKYLKELDLRSKNFSDTGIKVLARVLPSLTLLEKLVLGYITVDEKRKQLFSALRNLKYLKELDLHGVHMCKPGVQTLARVLPLLTLLEKLDLGYMFAFDDDFDELLFALGNLKYLKELHLSKKRIKKTGVEALARVLPSLTLLEKLVIEWIDRYDECDEQLFLAALGNLKYLKELHLSEVRFRKTGVEALARVLPSLTLLEKLVMGRIGRYDDCDEQLFLAALGNLKYLKELDLGEVTIWKTGAEALARVLPSLTLLEKLVLGEIYSDDECDEQLFAALGNLKYLKELDLIDVPIRKTGGEALARVLPSLTLLEKLVLRYIFFDNECDEQQLFAALKNVKYLKELNILFYTRSTKINKTGAEALARVLPSLTLLENLVLEWIDSDECDEQLFAAVENLKYLKELYLSGININNTCAKALARVLTSLTLLEKLVLGQMDFDDECDEQLFAALGNLKYLKELVFNEVYISKTGAATLTTTLPRLRSLETFTLPWIENDEDETLENNLKTVASFVPNVD